MTFFFPSWKKGLALFSVFTILGTEIGQSFALGLENTQIVPTGMEQSPLSESKISNLYKYLFGERSPIKSSTLLEADNKGILELDKKSLAGYSVSSSGVTTYDFSYGKALYDSNIAIVDLPSSGSGRITYEAPYYCDLLISSLAKYTKIGNNICLPNYATFDQKWLENNERTYVSVIKTSDLAGADLSRFGIIIFPDIILGKHGEILDSIGSVGINHIKAFTENGGIAYFSSKSLLLADKMGLTNGVVDTSTLVKHRENQGKLALAENTDFTSQVLDYGLYEGKNYSSKSGSGFYDYLVGSYFVNPKADSGVVPVRYFDTQNDSKYYFQDLNTLENADLETSNVLAAFYKSYGKGLVAYNGGNSLFSPQTNSHKLFINHTLNAILLSFLREIHVGAKVVQKSNPDLKENLVPSLERNIILEYSLNGTNVFNGTTSNLQAVITMSTGGLLVNGNLPNECSFSGTTNIVCEKNTLSPGEKWNISIGLRVDEPTFTQAGTKIPVTKTHLLYTDSKGLKVDQNLGSQTVNSVESANMRASLNIDPAGYYPLPGEGVYIDQVLNTENKGPSEAVNVKYGVTVPLISPLFDENDQMQLISRLVFAKDYHNSLYNSGTKTNVYPFVNSGECAVGDPVEAGRCQDFVVPRLFPSRAVPVDNYDEPVKRRSSDADEAYANIFTGGVITSDLGPNIMKQTFLPDADKLFTHASPRRMVYEYPVKKELLFARQDVYFYNNPAFPLPKGITNSGSFISIDDYADCSKISGSYEYPTGIVAGKYPNSLSCNASGALLPWVNNKISWNNLPEGVEQTDYLYPIDPKNNITSAAELEGFDADGNYIGQKDDAGNTSADYPIQYVRGAYANLSLPARSTPKGGYLEFELPTGASGSGVYVLADHIAITKIEQNGNTIRAYFYRGKLPNEQSLKSPIGLAFLGYDQAVPGVSVKVYSLKYNLSGNIINEYEHEQDISVDFSPYGFLKMPAVKLSFELPRRKRIHESDITNLQLTEGQVNTLFTRPNYYESALVFAKNTLAEITTLANRSGLTDDQKTSLLQIFTNTPTESYVRSYENLEPFVRFGTYIQELAFHRTVWGTAEDHPIKDPGIMADRPMFANVGTVGIAPIPFREYLTTGVSQIIPMARENTRVEYTDIFGRDFAAPIRTVVPEAVPLPPPLRNFMMNTTYEMYDSGGIRKYNWDGESELEIRQNIKLYNNYPKFFDPTICSDNPSSPNYGHCWDGTGSALTGYSGSGTYLLSDHAMDDTDFFWTHNIELFATKSAYDTFMSNLALTMYGSGSTLPVDYTVKTLSRAADGKGEIHLIPGEKIDDRAHNYSPEVERYYPENYIGNSMWNLTHFDYDDSVYAKGYPYHMDNLLPNPYSNIKLPHNIVAVPMARGTNYKTKYFKEEPLYGQFEAQNSGKIENNITPFTSWKYPDKKGWWGENLQNRDTTLLAGQDHSETIPYSVNGNDYLKPALIGNDSFERLATTNVYACLFNPDALKDTPGSYSYKPNVVKNNIIPMIPWIQKENENANYLSNYACVQNPYEATALPKVNNIVETENAYWLYFASNLRGEAKEAMNIISRITPFSNQKYEGDVKAVEGGRFVYWNPALGPNAFEIVDSPVSVVKSVNSDISIEKELIPYTLKTSSTDAYVLYTVKDPGEIQLDANGKETPRTWKDETYIDSNGDGNYSTSVYVGSNYNGAAKKSMLRPGETTLVRLDIYNNSGYDWAMLGSGSVANDNGQFTTHISGGIDFTIEGNQALNANDLISKITRNVLRPEKYNFLKVTIPDEIKPYVTATPSDANIKTPGTFFDFDFVNVTTIRDGFKGSYFLDISVDPNIPEALRGKVHDIRVELDPTFFDRIPGGNDPVGWNSLPHIPNIKFAIADENGNAYYRSGFSKNLQLSMEYDGGFHFDGAYELTNEGVDTLRLAAGDGTNKHRRLREAYENLSASGFALRSFPVSETNSGSNTLATIDFSGAGITEFPYVNGSGTIIPKTTILVHLKKDSLTDGEHQIVAADTISFTNFAERAKTHTNTTPLVGYAQGPKLDIHYISSLIGQTPNDALEIQKLTEGENTVEVKLFLKNTGTDIAFNPTLKVQVGSGVTISPLTTNATLSGSTVIIRGFYNASGALESEGEAVGPGITNYFPIYLSYSGSVSDVPLTLVENAAYEFTPYDPILPSLSGSTSTGFALDFAKTSISYEKTGLDTFAASFSGNTVGIYWDISAAGEGILGTKETASGSEVLAKDLMLDPTRFNQINAISYFKTAGGDFKKIAEMSTTIPRVDPTISVLKSNYTGADSLELELTTNKLGRHDGVYLIRSSQGDTATGFTSVPDNGHINMVIPNIDTSTGTIVTAEIYGSGGTYLTGTTFTVTGEGDRLSELKAMRTGSRVKLQFKTNKIKNSCYQVKRDGETISDTCLPIRGESNIFFDQSADVFKDYLYRVDLYLSGASTPLLSANALYASPNPDTSSIPLKIVDTDEITSDVIFSKAKDFGDVYAIENTPVRYAVRLRTASQNSLTQASSDGKIELTYATGGGLLYAGNNWNKILEQPHFLSGSETLTGYTQISQVGVGNDNSPIILDGVTSLRIYDIWDAPAKVTSIHNGEFREIPMCSSQELHPSDCYIYSVNHVDIFTKKFSSYTLWKLAPVVTIPPSRNSGGGSYGPPISPERRGTSDTSATISFVPSNSTTESPIVQPQKTTGTKGIRTPNRPAKMKLRDLLKLEQKMKKKLQKISSKNSRSH